MNPPTRRGLAHALLAASLLLNASMVAYLATSGGLRRVGMKFNLIGASPRRAAFQEAEEDRFRKLPNRAGEVFFAGDSLIAFGPWDDLYSTIHNRGIGGEKSLGLLRRIDEVIEDRPRKLFLLIGANDLASAVPPAQFLANYRKILERIRDESPSTTAYVLGVLPVNQGFAPAPTYTSADVRDVNRRLKDLVEEFPGARFVDATDRLVDATGQLDPAFTDDGLHLTVPGYLALSERVTPLVLGGGPAKPPQESPRP